MTRVTTSLLAMTCLCLCQKATGEDEFKDDPKARALYDGMVKAMREAKSLYYESDYRFGAEKTGFRRATYRIWLKKPNYFRVEASKFGSDAVSGVLVGDGDHLWIYWPGGKRRYTWEQSGEYAREYEKHRMTFYMNKPAPLARHSIGHEVGSLGAGMSMTVLDPSTF
ncbi:MAG: LolA family protein, partial [Planctomycetota bacterium]